MKKNILTIFVILTLAFTLFMTGCEEDKPERDFPGYLVGTWARTATSDLPIFSIAGDLSFECEVVMPSPGDPHAKVSGKLDHKAEGLGPNDYIIRDMKTIGGAEFSEGNNILNQQLGGFQNLLATLAPSDNNTKFEFTAKNQAAKMFFGGVYTKK